jgi:predicted protein tyrosine phosphatase
MIRIMSQRAVVNLLEADHPQRHNLIFITHPDDPYALKGTAGLSALAKSFLLLGFHDISKEMEGILGPTKEHVMTALEFAEGKDDLIICCHAGVSRSSGTAYVIATQRTNPKEALNVLEVGKHYPNLLVVKHGSIILDKPEMVELILDFHSRSQEHEVAKTMRDTLVGSYLFTE